MLSNMIKYISVSIYLLIELQAVVPTMNAWCLLAPQVLTILELVGKFLPILGHNE